MRLGDFAEHIATIRGGWTGYHGQRRWQGALEMPVAGRALMLVETDGAAFYAKTGALPPGATVVDLLLRGPNPDGSVQVMLRAGGTSCAEARIPAASSAAMAIAAETMLRTGWVMPWAAAPGAAIRWLTLAATDVASHRNGIWAVKPRHLAGLPESWAAALSRGRQGRMRD